MEAMVSVQFVKFASFSSAFWSSEPYTRGYVRAASRTRFPGTSLAVVQKAESGRRTGSSSHVDVTESSERVNAQGSRKFDRVSAHAIDEDDSTPVKGSSHWPRIEGASNPLTSEEESVLAAEVQDLVQLQRQRDELEAKLGRTPSVEEWADFVGSSVFRLYARIGRGRAAKRKMVSANLPLVHSVAGRFLGKGLSHTELCQEGVLGLLKSTEKYDTSYKTKFSSYTFLWIWEGMSAAVKKFRHVLRISRTVYETASLVLRHKEEFQSSHGREPTLQELADLSLVDKDTIRNTMRLVRPAKSLEQMVSTVDGEYEKQVADPDRSVRPWFHLRDEDMKMDINNALHSLSSREQEVLEMRYGLDGKRPLSRAEVASLMNLSYETIRLTEKKALGKLRHIAKEDGLQAYLSRTFWDQ
ncbi:protein MpSIGX [Marchantia polymorpha subsp. ruderalis]